MSQGRGGAGQAMAMVVVLVLCLLVHMEQVHAATYMVGDSGGWSFNTDSWPSGKRFRAGDVLGKYIITSSLFINSTEFCYLLAGV